MTNHLPRVVLLVCGLACTSLSYAEENRAALPASPQPTPSAERLAWWRDARFGMFIHWGPVSLKETEISWSRANTNPKCPNNGEIPAKVYDNLYKEFNPTNFDAREWVAIAKAAGMKYMVLTAKHCDGFLLWDSRVDDYNIMHTPFKRDVCAQLAQAAHEQGMRIGWYFSPMDWRDPDCRNEHNDRFVAKMQGELRELLSNYGRIDLLWFDCDGREVPWDQERTYALVKKLQPEIIINNRLDLGPGTDAGSPRSIGPQADYFTPEQWIGGYEDQHPWESCMTTSRRGQWAWGGHKDGVKSRGQVMEMLIRCAGGDGNVLLNVGPMPNGRIAPEQVKRVKEMGEWLAKFGESIYGTRGGPFKPGAYGVSTRKGHTIYLHICDWVEDPVRLPATPARVVRSHVLTGGTARVRQSEGVIEISVPESDRQALDTIVALELDRPANELAAVDVHGVVSLSTKAKASASNVFQNHAQFAADKAVDGNPETRWAADAGVHQAWLEVDLGKAKTFDRCRVSEAFPNRVQKFELQQWRDSGWKTFCTGTTIGETWTRRFEPVTAQRVRLNILDSTDGPTLWEFQLFGTAN
jgi:alpha-L-fucosidase